MVFLVPILVIFMLITPLIPDVPLFMEFPESSSATLSPEYEYDEIVSITRDGRLVHRAVTVSPELLSVRLRAIRKRSTHQPVVRLRVDRYAPFRSVRMATLAARDAGFARVTIMVTPAAGRLKFQT